MGLVGLSPSYFWLLCPGADLSDYFNYGFNEETWKAYCEKQRRLQLGLEPSIPVSTENKITVRGAAGQTDGHTAWKDLVV